MKSYNSIYPIFDEELKQVEMMICRSILYERHPKSTSAFLYRLKYKIQYVRGLLQKEPSLSALNLAHQINELYKLDDSAHIINLLIYLREDPRRDRVSTLILPMPILKTLSRPPLQHQF